MEWISVISELPKEDTPHDEWLIAYSIADGVFPARFVKSDIGYFQHLLELDYDGEPDWVFVPMDSSHISKYNATHWAHRPDIPKAKGHN